MKRVPLRRITPLRSHSQLARSPLAQQSQKRKKERQLRSAVIELVHARAGGRCQAAQLVPEVQCSGPMDVDEIAPRSAKPGGHLDPENCQLLCRAHHDWKHAHPDDAHARGLRKWSWER